eukprot:TRINITY_DN5825_c0_g1_i5.p2 TRINITY_DN5825_c0_g1~~TRINITY_DN5825_c0_g1_i5.p2  ORF type:complete len:194 (-),score=24.46 TRINITY_DN5825_c0_g1_i5:159-740(-)
MEVPNAKNRWDSPLVNIRHYEKTPLDRIEEILLKEGKTARDPVSTKPDVQFDTNFVYELDKVTQEIINHVIERQNEMWVPGMLVSYEGSKTKLKMTRQVTPIELKKLRQEFMAVTRQHPPKSAAEIPEFFLVFLQAALDRVSQFVGVCVFIVITVVVCVRIYVCQKCICVHIINTQHAKVTPRKKNETLEYRS